MNDKDKVVNRLIGCVCENDHKICGIRQSNGSYICLRNIGHTGKHIACGDSEFHNLSEW